LRLNLKTIRISPTFEGNVTFWVSDWIHRACDKPRLYLSWIWPSDMFQFRLF